ncbi:MAG: alcohol dehydrogenase [Acidobacteria bacterium SCN 69-37]|nr:MAG: alcohol dehydrogenase [Acidobacteria bacterium SCN 69-37]
MSFAFSTPRVLVGRGAAREVGAAAVASGRQVCLVTGRTPRRAARVRDVLEAAGATVTVWPTNGEPSLDDITRGVTAARDAACDVIVAVGGGSVLDAGKAIAALATNDGALLDYLEVIGAGRPLERPALPVVAVPTTAGTGSEVTRNAVLASREHGVKVSLRSTHMLPRVAIVDPELTMDVSREVTATTGLDALTQLIEAFVSVRATPMTDALAVAGIPRAAAALPRVWRNGHDLDAREDMAIASLWSGMALANAGLGAVHGFAGPIGGLFEAPHGAICAALLPPVMAANIAALRRAGNDAALARFDRVAQLVTGSRDAVAGDGVAWVEQLCHDLGIPGLAQFGITPRDIARIVPHARRASSMKGNPIELGDDELSSILAAAM